MRECGESGQFAGDGAGLLVEGEGSLQAVLVPVALAAERLHDARIEVDLIARRP